MKWKNFQSKEIHKTNEWRENWMLVRLPEGTTRYTIARWECGHGWQDTLGRSIDEPTHYLVIEPPEECCRVKESAEKWEAENLRREESKLYRGTEGK